jgi:ankyrin repeat protein
MFRHDGATPLHVAVLANNLAAVTMLLQHRALIYVADAAGRTPISIAYARGNAAITQALVRSQLHRTESPSIDRLGNHPHPVTMHRLAIAQSLIQSLSPK